MLRLIGNFILKGRKKYADFYRIFSNYHFLLKKWVGGDGGQLSFPTMFSGLTHSSNCSGVK